jgi:hypothetical protein
VDQREAGELGVGGWATLRVRDRSRAEAAGIALVNVSTGQQVNSSASGKAPTRGGRPGRSALPCIIMPG